MFLRAKRKSGTSKRGSIGSSGKKAAARKGFSSGKIPDEARSLNPSLFASKTTTIRSACVFSFCFCCFFFSLLFLLFSRTLWPETAQRVSDMDLQSSTPEEYLDGRVLADEPGLGDGSLAVEGDGGLPAQTGVDDRRDLLLLPQRLFLVSAKAKTTFVGQQ